MFITIVICTFNRSKILSETLKNYCSLIKSSDENVELLIIDNNSNDNTRKVCEEFIQTYPEARYVFEPTPGLSHARNTGIKEALGDIIAFVDDDVFFDPNWLIEVINIFDQYPEASCMGGKSIPTFEGGTPEWVDTELLRFYGSTNSGESIKWMIYPEYPYGLNMAFRRDVFTKIGEFNISLGRKKKNLLSNEENEIFWRVDQAGLKVIYNPKAILYHRIPKERATQEWILSRSYWQGISAFVFEQKIHSKSKLELIAEAVSLYKNLFIKLFGLTWQPKKMYWHYKAIKFTEKRTIMVLMGRSKQLLIEILSF
ncbi:glycosyltransferase [Methylotuvimicrobium sp. KM2]|uniref:glycosyltransferase family 2 protein n=1 Tax=Methylotuvimicrobium sp. KM2 TaxID=3133976 RepID=UPI0031015BC1